ncbi:hypothetical protein [Pseudomonas viridiflava]
MNDTKALVYTVEDTIFLVTAWSLPTLRAGTPTPCPYRY